jgi:hypothetical protein
METLSPDLIAELLAGRSTRERKLAVCSGTVPLAPADRVKLLCILAFDPDEMVNSRAKDVLISQPHEAFLLALARPDAPPALFQWCARHVAEKPGIADAMASNRNCSAEHIVPVVRHLTTQSIQLLMEELDRITALPALAAALELSASVTTEQKHLLHELRGEAFDPAALEQLLKDGNDPEKRLTVSQQINKMTVPQRIQMALKGDTEARRILIRDSSKVVQRAVLQSPRLTEREIENFSAETGQSEEVLRHIANDRNYRKNYTIIHNLMFNPKTPIDVTLHMLLLLNPTDVKLLGGNRNVPEPLRKAALKLFRQRQIDRHLQQ